MSLTFKEFKGKLTKENKEMLNGRGEDIEYFDNKLKKWLSDFLIYSEYEPEKIRELKPIADDMKNLQKYIASMEDLFDVNKIRENAATAAADSIEQLCKLADSNEPLTDKQKKDALEHIARVYTYDNNLLPQECDISMDDYLESVRPLSKSKVFAEKVGEITPERLKNICKNPGEIISIQSALSEPKTKERLSQEIKNINDRLKYRSFLDIVNTIKNEFEGKVKSISDLSFVTKDYQKVKDIKLNNYDSSPLPIKEVSIEYNSLTENKFSKNSNKLLTKEELYIVNKGLDVHYAFEVTDFKNPDFNIKYGEYVKRFLDNDLFKNVKDAKVFKEYEFMYEENNSKYHGIIDLMLMYEDHVDIIDYKLSNIDDSNYMKQLNGYKNYISEKTRLSINTYLYSIEKDEFKIV